MGVTELQAIQWMKSWPDRKIDRLSFKERFIHDSLSFYWMMENWLYESYAYYDSFLEIIRTVDKLLEKKELICIDNESLECRAAKLIAKQKGIRLKLIKGSFVDKFNNTKKRDIKIKLIKFYVESAHIIRKLLWDKKPRKTKSPILFISTDDWRIVGNKKIDPYLYPIVVELQTRNYLTLETIFSYQPNFIQNLLGKSKDKLMNFVIIEKYDNKKVRKKVNEVFKKFNREYNKLKKNREFQELFVYKGIKLWPLTEPQLSCYFSFRLKNHLWDYELLKGVIERERPCLAVIGDETREFGKQLFHICKKKNIPTLAMQHGAIENTIRVTHKKGELEGNTYCPIPTITVVYGIKDKEYLLKDFYPENSVKVTGSQRHDFLINNDYNKNKICDELKLNPERKIIVFATQTLPQNEKEKLTLAICKAAKQLKLQLVIKIHPSEMDNGFYSSIVNDTKIRAVVIKDYDTYKAIFVSDLVITAYSTVGLEAMIMGKPLVTGNFSGENQRWVNYAEEGAAIEVTTEEEMIKAINSILNNKKTKNKLKLSMKKYIYEYAFKPDGRASERIVKIIEELCK